jgi:hypothetical protein
LWTPENIIEELGTGGAFELARDTVLRGAAVRSRDAGGTNGAQGFGTPREDPLSTGHPAAPGVTSA